MQIRLLDTRDHNRESAGLTYVYPVISRRAGGVSIGINLNPNNACNWRCIYCQVPNLTRGSAPPIDLDLLGRELRGFLREALTDDFMHRRVPEDARRVVDIAISGNGEPTSAREFAQVIELVATVREEFSLGPQVRTRLITNGSLLGRRSVQQGIERLAACEGEVWFKVDAGTRAGFARINGVVLAPQQVATNLRRCARLCPTWVQTCIFARDGKTPDGAEIEAYVDVLRTAGTDLLAGVLLYGLARPSLQPEAPRLAPAPEAAMAELAARIRGLGLTVRVSP
jgi:wyosine [tRNA(Phe)-imidazoG37] synthetase (radical SAM superfamily)